MDVPMRKLGADLETANKVLGWLNIGREYFPYVMRLLWEHRAEDITHEMVEEMARL